VRVVSVGSELPGVLAVGQRATGILAIGQEASGFIAIGQLATGVIAIGQLALGVVAIGQLARGVIAVGQLSLGLVAGGMVSAGVLWCPGFGVGGVSGSPAAYGLFGRLRRQRLIAWVRREPWDRPPRWPAWRRAVGVAGLVVLTVLWWFLAGQPLVDALS
jgi:hypothetical protein